MHRSSERGSILIHVATGLVALIAFSAMAVDMGVLWAARAQAQSVADAGAMAGAISREFDDLADPPVVGGVAYNAAIAGAKQNKIWGDVPTTLQISWNRPNGVPAFIQGKFARVDVFRNGENGSTKLPTFFLQLVGVTAQGVKATATAVAAQANGVNCLRPWMIPDKWQENSSPPDTTYEGPPDVYTPPDATGANGTGYTIADIGTVVTFHPGDPHDAIAPSDYYDVDLDGTGGANLRDNIAHCSGFSTSLGSTLTVFPGGHVGPTKQGVDDLIKEDKDATWNGTEVINSCCPISPRVVPVAMFNPAAYAAQDRQSGRFDLTVVNIMGFFVLGIDKDGNVTGVLMAQPGELIGGPTVTSPFLQKVILVR